MPLGARGRSTSAPARRRRSQDEHATCLFLASTTTGAEQGDPSLEKGEGWNSGVAGPEVLRDKEVRLRQFHGTVRQRQQVVSSGGKNVPKQFWADLTIDTDDNLAKKLGVWAAAPSSFKRTTASFEFTAQEWATLFANREAPTVKLTLEIQESRAITFWETADFCSIPTAAQIWH